MKLVSIRARKPPPAVEFANGFSLRGLTVNAGVELANWRDVFSTSNFWNSHEVHSKFSLEPEWLEPKIFSGCIEIGESEFTAEDSPS